jgi:hypothetical protein
MATRPAPRAAAALKPAASEVGAATRQSAGNRNAMRETAREYSRAAADHALTSGYPVGTRGRMPGA